jgi:alpha-1,6-mannosyltransferase
VVPGPRDARTSTPHGDVVEVRAPLVGGGYRLILEPWRVVDVLERFAPTSLEVSDKSTLLPVTRWARRAGVPAVLFSHERLDAMLSLRTGWSGGIATSVGVLNRLLVRQFDQVVVTSRFALREFRETADRVGTNLHRVPLGVDLETFRPGPDRRRGPVLRLVHAGRLSREKSPHLAVATAVALRGACRSGSTCTAPGRTATSSSPSPDPRPSSSTATSPGVGTWLNGWAGPTSRSRCARERRSVWPSSRRWPAARRS